MPETERDDPAAREAASDASAVELWVKWLKGGREARAASDKERERAFKYVKGGEAQLQQFADAKWEGAKAAANYLYPTHKVLLPHLIPRHPRGLMLPAPAATPEVAESIHVLEEKVAYDWREGRYLRECRKAVNETLMGGTGWVRVAWDEERQIPEVKHVKPTKVVVDPEAEEELSEAGWVAQQVTMRVADLKADEFFSNTEKLKPETFGSGYEKGDIGASLSRFMAESLSTVRVWFIWSRRGEGRPHAPSEKEQEEALGDNVLLCYAEGHDFWLHKSPWPLSFDHDEFPFRALRFNYDPDKFYAYGPMQPALALQDFLNWQVAFLIQHTKKGAVVKVVYDKGMVTQEQLARVFNGVDFEAVAVDFIDGKKPFEIISLESDPTKLEGTIQIAKQMIFDITGAAELIMGGQGKTQSATEADIRERRAQNRIDDMRDQVKDFLIDINRAVAMVEILKTPARSTTTEHGIDFFLGDAAIGPWERLKKLDPTTMRAEVMFDIDAGTMRRPTREQQLQDLFGLWDRLAPLYMQTGRFDLLQKLIARVIRALELADAQELIPTDLGPAGPPPEQVQAEQQAQAQAQQVAMQEQMAAQQKDQAIQAAFAQVQQAIEQVRGEAGQGVMGARAEIQAMLQGFQAALQASGQNMAMALTTAAQQTAQVAAASGLQGVQAGLAAAPAVMAQQTAAQEIQEAGEAAQQAISGTAEEAKSAIAATVAEAQEAVEQDLEDASTPVAFTQEVERDGQGFIRRITGTIGGGGGDA
jgi:hypothetical protein